METGIWLQIRGYCEKFIAYSCQVSISAEALALQKIPHINREKKFLREMRGLEQ
jgi:hypothetical protein